MSEQGDFRCPSCGLTLVDVVLPVRHACRGRATVASPPPKPDRVTALAATIDVTGCRHRGDLLERIVCRGCGSRGVELDVYACAIHGRCHMTRGSDSRAGMDCRVCAIASEGFEAKT